MENVIKIKYVSVLKGIWDSIAVRLYVIRNAWMEEIVLHRVCVVALPDFKGDIVKEVSANLL